MAKKQEKHQPFSDAVITKHKRKHGKVFHIEVTGEDEEAIHFLFKKPDMKTLAASAKFAESDPIRAAQIIFRNCLLEGDSGYAEDVEVFTAVMPHLNELNKKREASLKEL